MEMMSDLNSEMWERRDDPPEDENKLTEDGYLKYNIHLRRPRNGDEITYMMQTLDDGKPLNAKLCGIVGSTDPLKQINICMMKVDEGLIKGIIIDSEWVVCKQ